jgi:signal transduction histidine kinase
VTSYLGAADPREAMGFRRSHPLLALLVVILFALVVVIEVIQPVTWQLLSVIAFAMLAAVVVTRAREDAARSRRDEQLEAELRETIQELRLSRARVAHVADTERRRIERDLHDGAQQRLIALRVKLSLAEELVVAGDRHVGELIQEIATDAETALEDLHALVHGIYPPLLTDRGLADALKAMVRAAPLRARLLADDLPRFPADVEAAVYFICAEALQNAAKHGGSGVTARIALRHESDGLAFEVRDDGCGFEMADQSGSGLANMEDRLSAVGGRLRVVSAPECGVVVQGWVPVFALEL